MAPAEMTMFFVRSSKLTPVPPALFEIRAICWRRFSSHCAEVMEDASLEVARLRKPKALSLTSILGDFVVGSMTTLPSEFFS